MDNVIGSVGPLYYCEVEIAVQPVEALIDSGSSATVMTFSLFQKIARDAQLSVDVLGEAICHTERLNWSDV